MAKRVGKYTTKVDKRGTLRVYDNQGKAVKQSVFADYQRKRLKKYRSTAKKRLRREGRFLPKYLDTHVKSIYKRNDLTVKQMQRLINKQQDEDWANVVNFVQEGKHTLSGWVKDSRLLSQVGVASRAGVELYYQNAKLAAIDLVVIINDLVAEEKRNVIAQYGSDIKIYFAELYVLYPEGKLVVTGEIKVHWNYS